MINQETGISPKITTNIKREQTIFRGLLTVLNTILHCIYSVRDNIKQYF